MQYYLKIPEITVRYLVILAIFYLAWFFHRSATAIYSVGHYRLRLAWCLDEGLDLTIDRGYQGSYSRGEKDQVLK